MLGNDWGVGQVFWSMLWFFLFFIWIWLLIMVFADIFRSHDMGGFAKALWVIFVIFLPYLGVFVYLIARGHKMSEHAIEARAGAGRRAARVHPERGRQHEQPGRRARPARRPEGEGRHRRRRVPAHEGPSHQFVTPVERLTARVLVVDPDGAVLLFRGRDPARPAGSEFWFTPGGGVEGDESLLVAAGRELFEETGLEIDVVGAPVFERTTEFDFEDPRIRQTEHFFVVRAERFRVDESNWTELERRFMLEHRWWTAEEIAASSDEIHPANLAALVADVVQSTR